MQLDERCRKQQLGEGWFETLEQVPRQAISMGIRQILRSKQIVVTVPDERKAEAVKNTLTGPVTPQCPASILQEHSNATIFLDEPAASLDPLARMQFLDLILDLIQTEGRTIIISSHILSDVEKVIDHVIIMDKATILRDCRYDEFQEEFSQIRLTASQGQLPEELPFVDIVDCQRDGEDAVLVLKNVVAEELERVEKQMNCQIEPQSLRLEDLYRLVMTEKDKRTVDVRA